MDRPHYEQCQFAYLKYMYASGQKRDALDKLNEFVSANLKSQMARYDQLQQMQQMNGMNGLTQMANSQMPALPAALAQLSPRDIQKRRAELENQLAKCHLKLGKWTNELEGFNELTAEAIIGHYELAKEHNNGTYKAWQAWAYANYDAIQYYKNNGTTLAERQRAVPYVIPAIRGFLVCIKLAAAASNAQPEANCLQDTLRLLTLWFDHCHTSEIYDTLSEGIKLTPMHIWLQVQDSSSYRTN